VEEQYSHLQKSSEAIYERNTIEISVKQRNRKQKPWATTEIIEKCIERDRLFRKSKNNPLNLNYRLEYVNKRDAVQKLIKRTKEQYYKNILSKMVKI